jgi:hypothetical protein
MSQMALNGAALGNPSQASSKFRSIHLVGTAASPRLPMRRSLVRCDAGPQDTGFGTALREAIDKATKKTITKDEILRNQETNESEQRSIFGARPTPGTPYGRPEIERRPETGDKSFFALWSFDGAVPETVNCRLVRKPKQLPLGYVPWPWLWLWHSGLTTIDIVFVLAMAGDVGYSVGVLRREGHWAHSDRAADCTRPNGSAGFHWSGAVVHIRIADSNFQRRVYRCSKLWALHSAGGEVERAIGHDRILLSDSYRAVPSGTSLPLDFPCSMPLCTNKEESETALEMYI